MNVGAWKRKNLGPRVKARIAHPWPVYKKAGGIEAVVIRANGNREDLGKISTTYVKRNMFEVSAK